jgi:hypothetical protein
VTPLAAWAVAGAALFPARATEAERLARLRPLFTPRPGSEHRVDAAERRDLSRKTSPLRLRGYVQIDPPRGHCLTIARGDELADELVCKPTRLAFTLEEMDRTGRLTWRVSTGDGDTGTDLTWRLPYRLAITEPYDDPPEAPPVYEVIETCTAARVEGARRIELGLMSGKRWVLRLPETDTLLPQPEPVPNLLLLQTGGKLSVKDASKKAEGGEHGGGEEKVEGGEHGEPPPRKSDKPEVPRPSDDRAEWAIPLRGSYAMNAAGFMPNGSIGGRIKGLCRYNYDGPPDDPGTGRIECHDADGYRLALLPLTCLGQVRPSR